MRNTSRNTGDFAPADEEAGAADDAADAVRTPPGGAVVTTPLTHDEEDGGLDNDEEEIMETIVVTPLPARQLRGRIFLRRLPPGNWVAVSEVPAIPDTKSTNADLDGLLINIPLCAMCLRITPDYPGASTVTTARIGQHSRLALDHTLRWTFDGPRFRAPHDNLLPDSTLARGAGQALASRLQPQLTGLTKHRSGCASRGCSE